MQMVLPLGIERTNEKLYEQVNIPATDRPPEDFGYTPVYIDTLDDVSWRLFVLHLTLLLAGFILCQFCSFFMVLFSIISHRLDT